MIERERIDLILDCAERWRITADSEVNDIDGWRNDPVEKSFRQPWEEPKHFSDDTTIVAKAIQQEGLSSQPVLDIHRAVLTWHETHDADDLPAQSTLRANLGQAMAVLQVFTGTLLTATGGNSVAALQALPDDATMNYKDLASKLGVDSERLRKRLDRWRSNNGDGWSEVADVLGREPRYLYRVGAIRPVLKAAIGKP